jgi:ribosomal-protein-alanine N-acetyltransferase
MSAVLQAPEARLEPMTIGHLDAVCAIEQTAYSHPWSRANFIDSLAVGYECRLLVGPAQAPRGAAPDAVIGYFVAMKGVDEVHLLNITVAPAFQRQGWAPLMLDALAGWSRAQGAQWLWLEVRTGNARALHVYERHGFRRVGVRRGYYPAHGGREDAIVMSLRLDAPPGTWGAMPS